MRPPPSFPQGPVSQRGPVLSVRQALFFWLLTMFIVLGVGLGVGLVATLGAIESGLTLERAKALLSDPSSSPLVTNPTWILTTISANEVAILISMVLFVKLKKLGFRRIFPVRFPPWKAFVGALFLTLGLAPLAEAASELCNRVVGGDVNAEQMVINIARGIDTHGVWLVLGVAALLPALVEEGMFRGVLTSAFERRSLTLRVLLPSLFFGIFHLEPTQVVGTCVLGVALGVARVYSGSLLPGILSHFVYNSGVLLYTQHTQFVAPRGIFPARIGLGLALSALGLVLLTSGPKVLMRSLRSGVVNSQRQPVSTDFKATRKP